MSEKIDRINVVPKCYDEISGKYNSRAKNARKREKRYYCKLLIDSIPTGARIQDLRCGDGSHYTDIDINDYSLIGVDISINQLRTARRINPSASYILVDMGNLNFKESTADAVTAFYSIVYLPLLRQESLIEGIYTWLKSGGIFLVHSEMDSDIRNWKRISLKKKYGFYRFETGYYQKIFEGAVFQIKSFKPETDTEFNEEVTFLWVVASKPV